MGGNIKNEAELLHLEPGHHGPLVPRMSEDQMAARLCALLGFRPGELQELRAMQARLCQVERHCETIVTYERRCRQIERLVGRTCCPGNVLYSQPMLDEFSDNNKIELTEIVQNFGAGFVNSFPVGPGQAIRLTHLNRPGYLPEKIAIDLALAGNATNYLDIRVQFYIVPIDEGSDTEPGKKIGPEYRANEFLNKDGTQIHLPFPTYRDQNIIIGSLEQLAVTIRHGGAANNLDSVFVRVYHDNDAWFKACCSDCREGKSCSCSM